MTLSPIVAVVLALAVYRATVLVTKDYICEPVRSLLRRFGRHGDYLSSCPWCCSVWAAAVLVPLTALVSWWSWVDAGLASSAVAGIVFERFNEQES